MKVIVGLGNPGAEYDATRHNVGWWVVDRLAYDWSFGAFRKERRRLITSGRVGEHTVVLVKPTTWMNRSGAAVGSLREEPDFDVATDLLVVVDDAALEVGKVRFRASGSSGGHNGLKSIESALGTRDYPRLRLGVGRCPEGVDLADWVLSPMPEEDEDAVVALLPELTPAVEFWLDGDTQATMDRFNR